jgi:Ca2+-binding RTX toxin-like protein
MVADAHKVYVEGSGQAHMANTGGRLYIADGNTGDIYGGKSADTIIGGSGDDVLYGMNGDDVLTGGIGADRLTGGKGSDTFKIASAAEGGDTIADFNLIVGERDTLDLTELFEANGLGNKSSAAALAAGHLVVTQAGGGVDVGFDKDGLLGAQDAVHLVTLEHTDLLHLDLTAILTNS